MSRQVALYAAALASSLAMVTASPAQAQEEQSAKQFIHRIIEHESKIAISLGKADFQWIEKQGKLLAQELGRMPTFDGKGLNCAFAAQSLFNATLDVKLPPTRAIKAYDGSRQDYISYMAECAKNAGVSFTARLPRRLD